jgi:hypothetical protein
VLLICELHLQVLPDPDFPTVKYPNPEEGEGALVGHSGLSTPDRETDFPPSLKGNNRQYYHTLSISSSPCLLGQYHTILDRKLFARQADLTKLLEWRIGCCVTINYIYVYRTLSLLLTCSQTTMPFIFRFFMLLFIYSVKSIKKKIKNKLIDC